MDIENFIAEFKKTFVYDMLKDYVTDEKLFDHFVTESGDIVFLKEQTRQMWSMWQAAKAQAVLEVKPSRHVTLTCAQLREAFMFGAPDKDDQEQLETEMTIQWSDEGHSGAGYYCYYADYPEEGAIKLGEAQEPTNESE